MGTWRGRKGQEVDGFVAPEKDDFIITAAAAETEVTSVGSGMKGRREEERERDRTRTRVLAHHWFSFQNSCNGSSRRGHWDLSGSVS